MITITVTNLHWRERSPRFSILRYLKILLMNTSQRLGIRYKWARCARWPWTPYT